MIPIFWPRSRKPAHPQKYMSVCIPTSPMKGLEAGFLRQSLDMLVRQTFKDFDVVITDHSKGDNIKDVVEEYRGKLDIHYYRDSRGPYTSSENLNRALDRATGKLLKIIFLDDFLYHDDALKDIVEAFDLERDHWLVTACEHTKDGVTYYWPFYPRYHDQIHLGDNYISSPSVVTLKNERPLLKFDRRMVWMMDVDFYKRMALRYGPPKVVNKINVVNRNGAHQASNTTATRERRGLEYKWVLVKFKEKELLKKYYEIMTWQVLFKRWFRKKPTLMKIKNYFFQKE